MATQEEQRAIEADQYKKLGELSKKVEQLTGAVDVANQINLELMKLLKKALSYEFWIIIVLIAVLIYGAVGEKGLYSVRQVIPVPSGAPADGGNAPTASGAILLPWSDDLRNWRAKG